MAAIAPTCATSPLARAGLCFNGSSAVSGNGGAMTIATAAQRSGPVPFDLEAGAFAPGELRVLGFEARERLSEPFELTVTTSRGRTSIPRGSSASPPGSACTSATRTGSSAASWPAPARGRKAPATAGAACSSRSCRAPGGSAKSSGAGSSRGSRSPRSWSRCSRGRHRRPGGADGPLRAARVLRAVPRERLDFVSPAARGGGHLLLLRARGRGKHVLVLGDAPSAHDPIAGGARLPFREQSGLAARERARRRASRAARAAPGKVTLRDFDFKPPCARPRRRPRPGRDADLEVYDYPGGYVEPAAGRCGSPHPPRGERAGAAGVERGESACPRLAPAALRARGAPGEPQRRVPRRRGSSTAAASRAMAGCDAGAKDAPYRNGFVLHPRGRPVPAGAGDAAARSCNGAQTAIVVGPRARRSTPTSTAA